MIDDIGETAVPVGGYDCDDAGMPLLPYTAVRLIDHLRQGVEAGRAAAHEAAHALSLIPPVWPVSGATIVARWCRDAAPGAQLEVGMYRLTRTADVRPTLAIEGPRGSTTAIEGTRLAPRAVAWIEADAARLRGAP